MTNPPSKQRERERARARGHMRFANMPPNMRALRLWSYMFEEERASDKSGILILFGPKTWQPWASSACVLRCRRWPSVLSPLSSCPGRGLVMAQRRAFPSASSNLVRARGDSIMRCEYSGALAADEAKQEPSADGSVSSVRREGADAADLAVQI